MVEAQQLRERGWRLVVVYCRISFDVHRRDAHGVEDQTRHCNRIAAENKMIVIHRFIDNGMSASKAGVVRPDFEAMLAALDKGATSTGYPIDGVVCVADDRLYRDEHTYQRFSRSFKAFPGRSYADELGPHDLYNEGSAQRGLMGAAAAQAESKKQQQRAKLNHRARAERGEPVSSRRPFGWNSDKYTLHPGESEVVRQGVQGLLAGKTLTAVTHEFTASGFTSTLGNPWQSQTVKWVLRNPRICGYRRLGGELVVGADGKPVVGQWEAIVSPDDWLAVAELLDKKRHPGGWDRSGTRSSPNSGYLLTGLVRCGGLTPEGRICGVQMHGAPAGNSYVYRCRTVTNGGCGRVSSQGPAVDDLITERALGLLTLRSPAPWPDEHRLETVRQRTSMLQEQWYAEEIDDTDYFSQLRCEEAQLKSLVKERKSWAWKQSSAGPPEMWSGMTLGERREALIRLIEVVAVLPGKKGSRTFDPARIVIVPRQNEASVA
ncbi:recombinase family protein [Streptomyces sp. NPDC048442]|uniref:recombinase family protein n=1 Tax=Streptomyces sp. NPDC048442 TaxID=3154823 RepID=UPI003429F637